MAKSDYYEKPKRTSRILAWILVIAWMVLIFILSSIPGSGYPSHPEPLNVVAHFILYFILGALLTRALSFTKMPFWKVALIAIVITSLYGASDEFHQFFVDGRNADVFDWLVDTIAGIEGTLVMTFYLSAKIVSRSRKRDRLG